MEYKIFVPKTFNEKRFNLFEIKTNRKKVYQLVLSKFDGLTIHDNNFGLWVDTDKKVYTDKIEILSIFSDKKKDKDIKEICLKIKNWFKQKSVLYVKDNNPYFV